MPLLPNLKPIFDAQHDAPPIPVGLPPGELRKSLHAMIDQTFFAFTSPREAFRDERDFKIDVNQGQITLRVYRPIENDDPLPCHIYYHGGGFFLGTLEQSDNLCRAVASNAGCVVVSVDYRLAPEHQFPVPVEDAYAALIWVAAHAAELSIDANRLTVGGGSAGGNLAAVIAQLARDRFGPKIIAQVLEIPVTDFTSTATVEFPEEGIFINSIKGYAPLYLRDEADGTNPAASPLLSASFEGLPPALIMCAEYDQLQPEGEAYATRLSSAGVPTVYRCWAGQFHGSQFLDKLIPDEVMTYNAEIASFLRTAYMAG